MRFPEDFLNELKSRVRLSDVVGRKVKLQKRGKDWVGLSPFSNEKTPSFYVHDDRGFYKCFSTQQAGDAITFLQETERLTFAEAVEKLARDAGMELPAQSPQEQQQYRKRNTLLDWAEKAAAFFESQLRTPAGAEARAYLEKRGFGPDAWTRHRMGFAPAGWRNLSDHLTRAGAKLDELVEAGLLVESEEGGKKGAPWDRFRNRVIFPISDPQGRVIAFGARTLEPDGKPKYLNSSDSPLFHKGKTLYRYMAAREELARLPKSYTGPLSRGLIVTEGYVDAIALAEAGIGTAVAPLGTALTEDQIELLWRAGPEPILCFDGDAAGVRAAYKSVDRALPMIEPGRTLYFALLPDGLDPDDMIRARGAAAMRDVLEGARPLVDLLWKRELEAEAVDTPERRAGFEARLAAAAAAIRHPGVRKAYERELRDRLYAHFRPKFTRAEGGAAGQKPGKWAKAPDDGRVLGPATRGILGSAARLAGLGLIVRGIETPALLEQSREAICAARFPDSDIAAIRDAAFDVLDSGEPLDRRAVAAHLRNLGRTRSEKLLEDYPRAVGLDLSKGEGGEWFSALERFPAAAAVGNEPRDFIQAVSGEGVFSEASHQARLKMIVAEREKTRRPSAEQSQQGSMEGVHDIRAALDGLGGAVQEKFSKD
jgi:DNA primase